jgi:hypothetical protein
MPDDTTILSLPLILPAQAQKHVTHNEALVALDLIVQLAVIDRTRTDPPALAVPGDRHIVAAGATGDWAGQAGRIALLAETGWQFTQALPGWRAHVLTEGQTAVFDGLGWSTLSDGPLEVTQLGVSATADATNRLSVASPATLLTHAGGGHQLKLNKAAASDTASLLFQTGFSGRAEMGTAGGEDFSVKVSADGVAWQTALSAEAATGEVTLPWPLHLGGQAADPVSAPDGTLWLNTTTGEVKVQSGGVALPVGGGSLADGDRGDVTVSGGGAVWTIDAGAVSLAKMADLATARIMGRTSAGTGVPEALTGSQATEVLEVFTSGSKGLAPASGGGTANFLRADGTWAAPAGGGAGDVTGPSSATDDSLARFDGTTGKLVTDGLILAPDTGELVLPSATPATPAAGSMAVYAQPEGGRMMPSFKGPSGLAATLQPHLGFNRFASLVPAGNNSTVTLSGFSTSALGTATAVNWAATDRRTRMTQIEYLVTTAATTAIAGWRNTHAKWTVGAATAGDGGFFMTCRWGPSTGAALSTHRGFCGMRTGNPSDANPSTLANIIGMAWDSGDTNIQFMHNDGSGTATKIDLGSAFPRPSVVRQDVYELTLFSPPGTTQVVSYRVRDLLSGAEATGTVTTDLPSTATGLVPAVHMSVGGTSSVVGVAVMGLTVESDY